MHTESQTVQFLTVVREALAIVEAILEIEEPSDIRDLDLNPPIESDIDLLLFLKAVFNTGSDSCFGKFDMGSI